MSTKLSVTKPRQPRRLCVHYRDGYTSPRGMCGYAMRTPNGAVCFVDRECIGPSKCGMYQERKADKEGGVK